MYTPFALFLNYHSTNPWWFGPVLQVAGFFLMWLTRQTAWAYPRWGRGYYVFSAIARPVGIALISWAWVEICTTNPPHFISSLSAVSYILIFAALLISVLDGALRSFLISIAVLTAISMIPRMDGPGPLIGGDLLLLLQLVFLSCIYSLWSILSLGIRPSFLYSKIDDHLITSGPYQYQRHPQLFAALAAVFFSSFLVRPMVGNLEQTLTFRLLNFLAMTVLTLLMIKWEDKELEKRFGQDFKKFRSSIPSLVSFRNRKGLATWKAAILSGLALFMSILFSGIYSPGNFNSILYKGFRPDITSNPWVNSNQWDLMMLAGKIELGSETGSETTKLPEDLLVEWKERGRASRYSPFPQTLFFCDQVFFDDHQPGDLENLRVRELPFSLKCSKDMVEFAQAMDSDGDGFARIDIYILENPKTGEGYRQKYLLAADDETNTFDPFVRNRLK